MKIQKNRVYYGILLLCGVLSVFSFVGMTLHSFAKIAVQANALASDSMPVILLDAGHGGEDGGAVGINGALEKEINLAITKKLKALLQLNGYEVVLTRESDAFIGDTTLETLAQRKKSDMQKRLEIMQSYPNAIFLSIHQNYFSNAANRGAQVFYATGIAVSETLANCLQEKFQTLLPTENNRTCLPAENTIYLMRNAVVPAVIVECGFLSNPEEAELLCQDDYQNQIAWILFCGISHYFATIQSAAPVV